MLRGKVVCPLAGLGCQFGPTEALEHISVCDQSPRASRHLSLQCPEDMAEVRTRERPSFLESSGGVPKALAQVWACWELSPCWGWPSRALRWGVVCEVEPGAWCPGQL